MRKLKISDLKKVCDPSSFPFKTTEDYVFEHEPLHQERGVSAIDFGLNVKADGYNIFVCGAAGTGRNTQVEKAVHEIASTQKTPDDWNKYEILCSDDTIELKVNGQFQNKTTGISINKGYIGFQSEGVPIMFRDFKLTPLK